MSLTIYHNPRCSKSRQTLTLIEERGQSPDIVRYRETPPNADELRLLLDKLGMQPRELIRKGEAVYRELGLDDPGLDDEALIAAMAEHPILMERPIVVKGNRAVLGRPPETVLAFLE